MKFYLLLIISLVAQYWEDTDAVKMFKHRVEEITLAQNEGRAPGSEGEAAVARYIWGEMKSAGVDMLTLEEGDIFGMIRPGGDTLVSRNVEGFVQGYDPALGKRYIVVGARMDNLGENVVIVDGTPVRQIYAGANGNASGLAMLCDLASRVAANGFLFKRSIVFVAFGSSTNSYAGAWHFLNNTFGKDADKIDAMVNLDILGIDKDGMMAFSAGNEDLNSLLRQSEASVQPLKLKYLSQEVYPSDYQVFYAKEIPSVTFTTGRYPEHNTHKDVASLLDYDFMERESEFIFNFLLTLANAPEGVPAFRNGSHAKAASSGELYSWTECDIPPAFLGNRKPSFFLEKWVYTYLKYPQECVRDGIQGRVMVEFTIGQDGKVHGAHVTRSVHPLLDEEAVRVVMASPKWTPGKVGGKKVDCTLTIPVEFRLQKKK